MNMRTQMRCVAAALATLGMCSAGHALDRDSEKLYEMQYELREILLMSQLDRGVQDQPDLMSVEGHALPLDRHPTQQECAANLPSLDIHAQVDGRLANAYGDRYPFLTARSKQYRTLFSAWQRVCGTK